MQYLGGKSSVAREIAEVVAPRGEWWEPFCGGLSVSVQLAKYGPGIVSDVNPALIALYRAVRRGWQPPEAVSEAEWRAARELPDSDPRKAFCGFACSFGAKWFAGYAGVRTPAKRDRHGREFLITLRPAIAGRRALLRDLPALRSCHLRCVSFFDVDPERAPAPECIYADPPYAGVEGYRGTAPFDHARFWRYCDLWAQRGVRVFVSEYACPVRSELAWERRFDVRLVGPRIARTERLFRVLPSQTQLQEAV